MIDQKLGSAMFGEEKALLELLKSETDIKRRLGNAFAGGTWIHHCAGDFSVNVIKALIAVGFDPNERGTLINDLPIIWACSHGRPENVKFLLECGNTLDTEPSESNPLFSAIHGAGQPNRHGDHLECARLILEAGMDTSVQYEMAKGNFYNAAAWADMYELKEMARLIRKY